MLRNARHGGRIARAHLFRRQRVDRLHELLGDLPAWLEPLLRYVLLDELGPRDREVVQRVEHLRQEVAARRDEKYDIFASPKPGTAGTVDNPTERPTAGRQRQLTAEWLAMMTSKHQFAGTVLYLLSDGSKAERIVEFGACVGISGAYLASGASCKEFITMEAWPALADVAQGVISQVHQNAHVRRGLFNDGVDKLLEEGGKFDLVYIDGHHEKVATIQYFERMIPLLNPNCVVLFDDIYWSEDMFAAWELLRARSGFSHAIDFGDVGACLWDGKSEHPRLIDLGPYTTFSGSWKAGHDRLQPLKSFVAELTPKALRE
jgi:predicted O-methyltransferase YrrM